MCFLSSKYLSLSMIKKQDIGKRKRKEKKQVEFERKLQMQIDNKRDDF